MQMDTFNILFAFLAIVTCNAFVPTLHRTITTQRASLSSAVGEQTAAKANFLEALDKPYDLNRNSETRTQLLNTVMDKVTSLPNPGSKESFSSVATGVWRVVYAPHMTIMASLVRGELSVEYDLREDGTMTSHAKYNFPLLNLHGYLSASGTYGSVNENVSRVDFDEAWIRTFDEDSIALEQGPYSDIETVPDSISKTLIRNIGRSFFIEPFAVFPVSFLDDNLIVFDFELLGTRICARKEI